ncbi:hypothetical protein [Haloechinothrix sp. LS1_15]|uniref:hypothetical protein n=1 Tax=Haloechinothrix sp. LS1_15 TaxID=2652248 RepID=UPI0029488D83|nr:hypothetical protein [Haloechinothrix sp. LS1_15]
MSVQHRPQPRSWLEPPHYRRAPHGTHPPLVTPEYRSTALRHPSAPSPSSSAVPARRYIGYASASAGRCARCSPRTPSSAGTSARSGSANCSIQRVISAAPAPSWRGRSRGIAVVGSSTRRSTDERRGARHRGRSRRGRGHADRGAERVAGQ